ncbi:restriction endonuclease subunit S [Flavobacterium piscinae]|uniref:Restriction endonuclease subunit S n=2 Tax=Flavobacterium piscinae TaxID=2506424 RepID=A0A4Q1KZW0_9FLAO|nr:restriction endonuclease subunit S [Flavobacterium piscinae]
MSKNMKIIPELRFPEFENEGEWEEKELGKLAKKITERNKDSLVKDVFTNSAIDGIVDQRDYFDKDIADKNNLENYYIVKEGDYVYNPRISNIAPVGPISKNKTNKEGAMSPLYTVFRFDSKNNDFFEYYFKSEHWYNAIRKVSNTGARFDRMSIADSAFMEIPVLSPSPKEQQKIASCLSSLDEVIAAHSQKLELLKDHKKGLMQNLFPQEGEKVPKYRFKEFEKDGEWLEKNLENYIDLFSGIALKSEEISDDQSGRPILRGINITEGYIRHSKDIDKYFLGSIENMEKYFVKKNDIVIGMDGSKVGKNVALVGKGDEDSILIQRVARIRTNEKADIHFIYQFLISDKFRAYVDIVNTSSGIPHISSQQIKDFKIGIPPKLKEQQKIASCLSSLDSLITAEAEKIEQLKWHKKGLMQGLFPKINE